MPDAKTSKDLSIEGVIAFMKQTYAFAEIIVEYENFSLTEVPKIYKPEPTIEDPQILEYVYDIYDYGDRLIASKNDDYLNFSMYRMFMTIEKMVAIMTEKIAAVTQDLDNPPEDWIFAIDGHEYCKRKLFEVIINHPENWLIINYDPGQWASTYLNGLKLLNQKNFPYPASAPRDSYRHRLGETGRDKGFKR